MGRVKRGEAEVEGAEESKVNRGTTERGEANKEYRKRRSRRS